MTSVGARLRPLGLLTTKRRRNRDASETSVILTKTEAEYTRSLFLYQGFLSPFRVPWKPIAKSGPAVAPKVPKPANENTRSLSNLTPSSCLRSRYSRSFRVRLAPAGSPNRKWRMSKDAKPIFRKAPLRALTHQLARLFQAQFRAAEVGERRQQALH